MNNKLTPAQRQLLKRGYDYLGKIESLLRNSEVSALQHRVGELEGERDGLAATVDRLRDAGTEMAKARGSKDSGNV